LISPASLGEIVVGAMSSRLDVEHADRFPSAKIAPNPSAIRVSIDRFCRIFSGIGQAFRLKSSSCRGQIIR
jgi:hypothetical protein